jgi:uncharacterized membrane protein YccC
MQPEAAARPSLLRRAVATLVLIAAAALIIKLTIHVVVGVLLTVFWIAVGLAVLVAILWALKTIL